MRRKKKVRRKQSQSGETLQKKRVKAKMRRGQKQQRKEVPRNQNHRPKRLRNRRSRTPVTMTYLWRIQRRRKTPKRRPRSLRQAMRTIRAGGGVPGWRIWGRRRTPPRSHPVSRRTTLTPSLRWAPRRKPPMTNSPPPKDATLRDRRLANVSVLNFVKDPLYTSEKWAFVF